LLVACHASYLATLRNVWITGMSRAPEVAFLARDQSERSVARRGSLQSGQSQRRHDESVASGPAYGRITGIVPPRVARIGFSYHF
jgi:hypothetical protein